MVFVKDGDILGFDWPSLDAMHEAELLLSFDQQTSFVQNLMCQHKDYPMTSAFFATAAQRAEAFLRTLNLWEPDTAPTAG